MFGVNTGRGYSGIQGELERHHMDCDFLICNNGGVVYEQSSEPIDQVTADGKVLASLVPFVLESGGWHAAICRIENGNEREYWIDSENSRENSAEKNRISIDQLKEIPFFSQLSTRYHRDEEAREHSRQINGRFGDMVTAFPNGVCIDIVPVGVNKAVGLFRYIKLKHVRKEHTLVIGDNFNDLDMILEFDGFSVNSGNPEVIAQARKAYDSIAGLIEEYI